MALPREMTVVEIAAPGGPEQLKPAVRPVPQPGENEVLVRVQAAGVNRPDVMQRQGRYPPPPGASDLPGMEVAGEIVALGPKVSGLSVGDKITSLLPGGGYAAYAIAAAPLAMPVPAGLSMVEAAAIPETFLTVWTNLFERGRCKAGDIVLIHGGTSGIGTTAIQLAKSFGARVFATAGSAQKARACEKLGASRGIDYKTEDFVEVIRAETKGYGVDITLDMVAGAYVQRNLEIAAVEGRVVTISTLGGSRAEINMGNIMLKRLTLTGSTLRSRTVAQKAAVAEGVRKNVWPLIEAGKVKPVIFKTFPLAEAGEAHRLMESSDHIGKIVLTV
ncbi:MAG TPA: NAD(P)H-quinone oxidoreductase [Steroidobacteraceae bacterium]|jgi:putative PIG3 family NAD(P)H quinone oxidoreductase|nr:NAD(P)H-quinone oxidoreductase [Steroidobacteraceae bacterium]